MLIVKLGGSVITNKRKYRTLRGQDLSRLAREVAAAADPETVVVHGAGSYGHILAAKHRLHMGFQNQDQLTAVAQVQRDVKALDVKVLDALLRARARPIAIPPSVVMRHRDGVLESFDIGPFRDYMKLGLLPVSFGDVVLDTTRRFSIASGDDIVLELAKAFRPDRVVFAADVDGVYTADPKRSTDATRIDVVDAEAMGRIEFADPEGSDVTGGLRAKLEKMRDIAKYARDVWIVNGLMRGRVERVTRGEAVVGTRVVA